MQAKQPQVCTIEATAMTLTTLVRKTQSATLQGAELPGKVTHGTSIIAEQQALNWRPGVQMMQAQPSIASFVLTRLGLFQPSFAMQCNGGSCFHSQDEVARAC